MKYDSKIINVKVSMHLLHRWRLVPNLEWVIKLFVLLCFCKARRTIEANYIMEEDYTIMSECDPEYMQDKNLPLDWPCEWNNGIIPFAYNFFSQSPKRLIGLVKNGLEFLEEMSCLRFKEHDPVVLANKPNITYLYFTYSGVMENCCLDFYTKPTGKRLVLITPTCLLPLEVAHVTLHGMGLYHTKQKAFSESKAKAVMFTAQCEKALEKAGKYDLTLAI